MFFVKPIVKPIVKKRISIPKLEKLLHIECAIQLHYKIF